MPKYGLETVLINFAKEGIKASWDAKDYESCTHYILTYNALLKQQEKGYHNA